MKRLSLILALMIVQSSLFAQDIALRIGRGKNIYVIEKHIIIDESGKIVAIDHDLFDTEVDIKGRISKVGNLSLTYYSDFNNHEAGKIKSINNINLEYYSNFNDYEAGKLKSIGNKKITYFSKFNKYEAAKIKSIGTTKFTYYSDFNSYESGKIKSIGAEKYTYFSNFDSHVTGRLKSGKRKFKADGITFLYATH